MIAHGTSAMVSDRLYANSDAYRIHVCGICGNSAIANLKRQSFECKVCKNTTRIVQIKVPYAMKLLTQELLAMGIQMRFFTDE